MERYPCKSRFFLVSQPNQADFSLSQLPQTIDFDFNSLQTSEIRGHLTRYGVPAIHSLQVIRPNDAQFVEGAGWLQAFTTYETAEGRGRGFLRLKESSPGAGDWKAFIFFVSSPFPPLPFYISADSCAHKSDCSLGDQRSRRIGSYSSSSRC